MRPKKNSKKFETILQNKTINWQLSFFGQFIMIKQLTAAILQFQQQCNEQRAKKRNKKQ